MPNYYLFYVKIAISKIELKETRPRDDHESDELNLLDSILQWIEIFLW